MRQQIVVQVEQIKNLRNRQSKLRLKVNSYTCTYIHLQNMQNCAFETSGHN